MRRAVLLLALTALAGCGGGSEPTAEPQRLGPIELVEALREGGYVVYLRHAATDRSKEDDPVLDLDDCATQRNLSEDGRDQSREIGEAFRRARDPDRRRLLERVLPNAGDGRARVRSATRTSPA